MQKLQLNLSWNKLGGKVENMMILRDSLKFLPNNLQSLSLYLSGNSFGGNELNLKYFVDILK